MTPLDAAGPGQLALLAGAMLVGGLLAGFVAGLLGVGGGIVAVPALFQAFSFLGVESGVRMHLAVGTSLATIVMTSLFSARAHYRRGAVDTGLLRLWAGPVVGGVVAGSAVSGIVSGAALSAVFAVVAAVVAVHMAAFHERVRIAAALPARAATAAMGAVVGLISSMMGIGGGTLSVPLLSLFSYPIRGAVGTAAAVGLLIAVPGTLGFAVSGLDIAGRPPGSLGYVNLIGFAAVVPASMLAAPWGAAAAHRIPPPLLRRAFAAFLLLTAARLLFDVVMR